MDEDIRAFNSFDKNLNIIIRVLFILKLKFNLKLEKVIIRGTKEATQAIFILKIEGSNIENKLVIIFSIVYK